MRRTFNIVTLTGIQISLLAVMAYICVLIPTAKAENETYKPLQQLEERLERARQNEQLAQVSAIPLYDASVLVSQTRSRQAGEDKTLLDHYINLANIKLNTAYALLEEHKTKHQINKLLRQRDQFISKNIAEQSQQRVQRDSLISQLRKEIKSSSLHTVQEEITTNKRETARGTIYTINGLVFDDQNASLHPGSQLALQPIVDTLQEAVDREIIVEAHTSNKGTRKSNLELSQKRANGVRDFLIYRGIDGERISPLGSGENFPLTDGSTNDSRDINERIEIILRK